MRVITAFSCFLLVPVASGCGAGWRRVGDLSPRAFPPRSQLQVWQGGRYTILHGITLDSATLSGVPFTQPLTCDSCRVQLALGTVDSLRVGNKERGFLRSTGLVLGIGLIIAYLFRGVGGN
jgi:hypothetical protein